MTGKPRILCVDDEPRVLDGLRHVLYRHFEIVTADGGDAALAHLAAGQTFDVIMSDMRMPKMNGATLLAEFRKRAPDTVRVLLTGQSELEAAILAVNEGQIFRFLTKPCAAPVLIPMLEAAVEQRRLITAEKVLLEQTLVGSVRAMTEVLALTHPEAFGGGPRRYERARAMAAQLKVAEPWHVEVACMLDTISYAVLPNDVTAKLTRGEPLEAQETEMLGRLPVTAERVLAHIPRLERVKEVLKHQKTWLGKGDATVNAAALPPGARILRILHDFGVAEARDGSLERALSWVSQRQERYGSDVFAALRAVCEESASELRALPLREVRAGMVLAADVKLESGTLILSRGQRVTEQLLLRLENFRARNLKEPILCEVPRSLG